MNRRPRILAVDDDPMNRIIVMEYLEEDYDLVVVASGQECLDALPTVRPDVVLLDIMMPGIDGYEVCRRIKAMPAYRHVKVILVSAKAMLEERLEGYDAGADDYVTKPFSGDELQAKLDVYLKLRSVEELDDLKGQFLGLLAHETRTPLTAVLSPANLLALELENQPRLLEMVTMIRNGATQLESMIDRALRLCELKAGTSAPDAHPVDLDAVLDAALEAAADTLAAKELDVTRHPVENAGIEGEPDDIAFVIRHLVAHLVGAAQPGGHLDLDWRAQTDSVELQIRDDDSSLEERWLPHLFEDFYVPSLENHSGPLDLDLALAGAIVRAHGGSISAQVDGSASTVFRVTLNRTLVPAGEPAPVG